MRSLKFTNFWKVRNTNIQAGPTVPTQNVQVLTPLMFKENTTGSGENV